MEIKPGGFIMGCRAGRDDVEGYKCSSDDRPHPVTLTRAYALGKQEVTVEQYAYYLWEKGRDDSGNLLQYSLDVDWSRRDHPMTYVDWDEVRDYARWLHGKVGSAETVVRLPTEAEWEYAARAGSETAYWWGGEEFDPLHANCGPQAPGTMPVGADKQRENGFGLQDMLGNVWEWVADEYRPYAEDSIKDPLVGKYDSANMSRVLRGGAWGGDPGFCRAAGRRRSPPDSRYGGIGFRVCRGAPIETLDAGPLNAEPLKP